MSTNPRPAQQPSSFELLPSYPNPFNSSVTIPFEITGNRPRTVSLSIYNTLGQEVYRVPAEIYLPGVHRHRFDGSGLGTGLYFVRVKAGYEAKTGKMVMLK